MEREGTGSVVKVIGVQQQRCAARFRVLRFFFLLFFSTIARVVVEPAA